MFKFTKINNSQRAFKKSSGGVSGSFNKTYPSSSSSKPPSKNNNMPSSMTSNTMDMK